LGLPVTVFAAALLVSEEAALVLVLVFGVKSVSQTR
jgi:hypothetical protein